VLKICAEIDRALYKLNVGIIFTSGCRSHDLMSCGSASPNRVAEEVYPTL
jgi:hypothetical protein